MPVTIVSGVIALFFLLSWMWRRDAAYPRELADAGKGLALPLYRNDEQSLGWWGMAVLLISDSAVAASIAFAYPFLWTAHPTEWPPAGSPIPGFVEPALILVLAVGAYALFEAAERLNRRDARLWTAVCLVLSAVLATVAIATGLTWLLDLGLDPTAHGYGASIWALLGWVAFHVALGAGMALWCLARLGLGMIDSWRCLTLRVCLLWWRFTLAFAAVALLLIVGFPYAVS
jgi:cytochrome c oxidase subunit I+III